MKLLRGTFGPLLLILSCPPFAILMWYTNTSLEGSFLQLSQLFLQNGFLTTIYQIWQPIFFGSTTAWLMIFIFIIFEFILLKIIKGKTYFGPTTPKGNTPVYTANGLATFLITIFTFCICSLYFHLFSPTIIYEQFGPLIGALNCLSLIVCAIFYLKGRFKPSSSDSSVSKNLIFDYYWGTELYPSWLGVNLKMFINCRLGMMSWALILISYAATQAKWYGLSNSMLVAVSLQLIYVTKFFIWETGYLASLDIMHDRAGFYICWGCLVWVPCVYTSPSMYLVLHPTHLQTSLALLIFLAGTISIMINYFADRQRQLIRITNGNCNIWGKKPKLILADYRTESGIEKKNLLLVSGWWGIARHFHYIPEITSAFFWSVPALFENFAPYFYVCFLTILLIDRSFRDDKRCAKKYGVFWHQYCQLVPFKIIPYVL